jgi:sugar/nucleoside kinase (ribokinase family)
MQSERAPDYLVIGQIVCDIQPDGRGVLGGTALYSALTASRLGLRVGVLTRGRYGERIDGVDVPSLEPFSDELTIITQAADSPTFFVNEYQGGRRVQTIRNWAGAIDLRGLPPHWASAKIIHLGPVAREIDPHQALSLSPGFLGITPQGWMREWPVESGGRVHLQQLRLPPELMARTDTIVVSDEEIAHARAAVEWIGARRIGVVTLGENGCTMIYAGHRAELPGYPVKTVDLTGAGDVFAAAFFSKASDRSISPVTAGSFANLVAALSLRGVGPDAVPPMAEITERFTNWEPKIVTRQ